MKISNKFQVIFYSALVFIHSFLVLYIFKFRIAVVNPEIASKTLNEQFELSSQSYTPDELMQFCKSFIKTIDSGETYNLYLLNIIGKIGLFWSVSLPIVAIIFFLLGKSRKNSC